MAMAMAMAMAALRVALLAVSLLWLLFAAYTGHVAHTINPGGPLSIVFLLPAVTAWHLAHAARRETPMSARDATVALCVGVSPLLAGRAFYVFVGYVACGVVLAVSMLVREVCPWV